MLLLFVLRFFVFHLYESPKYLMGRGRDEDAVEVVRKVARYNGVESRLTLEMLQECERVYGSKTGGAVAGDEEKGTGEDGPELVMETSALAAFRRSVSGFSSDHVSALFATRKLAWSTTLLIVVWGKSSSLFFDEYEH